MKKVVNFIDRISFFGGALSGAMLCIGLGLFVVEIFMRSVLHSTIYVTEEYSGYLMSALTMCGLAYTLSERAHIRMTFLLNVMKGRKRVYLDMACYITGLGVSFLIIRFTGGAFIDAIVTGSRSMQISETPMAIPLFFLPVGGLLLALQFTAEIIRSVYMLRGDTAGINIKEEIKGLGR